MKPRPLFCAEGNGMQTEHENTENLLVGIGILLALTGTACIGAGMYWRNWHAIAGGSIFILLGAGIVLALTYAISLRKSLASYQAKRDDFDRMDKDVKESFRKTSGRIV